MDRQHGAIRARALLKQLDGRASAATAAALPYYARVAAVSGTQVAVTVGSATTPGQELLARLAGIASVGDYGIVIPLLNGDRVFARIAAGTDVPRIPIDLTIPAKASTTNTSTYITQVTNDVTLQPGTYGCEIRASGLLWRSVATGESWLQLRVGGISAAVMAASADGLVLTQATTLITRILRTAASNPIVITTPTPLTIALDFRGGGAGGTTNIVNAEIHGELYRIA